MNLEGVCLVKDLLVLGNRGNRSYQDNHLVITDRNFWEDQENSKLLIKKLLIPTDSAQSALGLSELCYIDKLDILLVTLTSEATDNSFDDGVIGNSHVGWINSASSTLQNNEIKLDGMIAFPEVDVAFKNEKIEGICYESVWGTEVVLHLISDFQTMIPVKASCLKSRWS